MGIFDGRGPMYDTRLTPEQEAQFRQWAGERIADTQDYDLRGAWLAKTQAADNGHLPDTFKKPNHPTFSDESQYSTPQQPGGRWVEDGRGGYVFWASPTNIQSRPLSELARYFKEVEPGHAFVAPINWSLRNAPRKR